MEFLKTAEELFHQGKYREALVQYREALNQGVTHPMVYYNMGVVKEKLGDLMGAEAMYKQAAELEPENPGPWNRMIQMYLEKGEMSRAEIVAGEFVIRYPEEMDGFHRLTDLLLMQDRAEEALELLEKAMPRFTSNPLYIYDLCRVLGEMGEGERGLALLDANHEIFTNGYYELLWKRGYALLLQRLNRMEEAIPLWKDVYEELGDRQAGMNCMMDALVRQAWEEVLSYAGGLTKQWVEDRTGYLALYFSAVAYKNQGEEAKKAEAYETLIERLTDMGENALMRQLRSVKIEAEIELGRWEDARQDLAAFEKELGSENVPPERREEANVILKKIRDRIDQGSSREK